MHQPKFYIHLVCNIAQKHIRKDNSICALIQVVVTKPLLHQNWEGLKKQHKIKQQSLPLQGPESRPGKHTGMTVLQGADCEKSYTKVKHALEENMWGNQGLIPPGGVKGWFWEKVYCNRTFKFHKPGRCILVGVQQGQRHRRVKACKNWKLSEAASLEDNYFGVGK